MGFIFALAALALPFASASAGETAPPASASGAGRQSDCANSNVHLADIRPKAEAKRLDQLPPGDLILTVVRDIDRCQVPVIVGRGYGFNAPVQDRRPARPPVRARRW